MGRLEHNDDIDKRIMKEIKACDFAIADLTYARPSVYFEAGFAQRSVPVTSRKDHRSALCQEHFLISTSGKRSYEIHGRCGRIHGSLRERERSVVRPAFAESG